MTKRMQLSEIVSNQGPTKVLYSKESYDTKKKVSKFDARNYKLSIHLSLKDYVSLWLFQSPQNSNFWLKSHCEILGGLLCDVFF